MVRLSSLSDDNRLLRHPQLGDCIAVTTAVIYVSTIVFAPASASAPGDAIWCAGGLSVPLASTQCVSAAKPVVRFRRKQVNGVDFLPAYMEIKSLRLAGAVPPLRLQHS